MISNLLFVLSRSKYGLDNYRFCTSQLLILSSYKSYEGRLSILFYAPCKEIDMLHLAICLFTV